MYYIDYNHYTVAGKRPVSLRIPDDVREVIEEAASHAGRGFSSVANEMLAEAVRMRRVPGIVFVDEPHGRAPWIAGSGLEVWDVVRAYRDMGQDWDQLRRAFDWLSEPQLRAALAYADAYPEYVQACERREAAADRERIWRDHPSTRPARRQVRLQLDEMLSARVAVIARSRGLDVVSSHECGRDGLADEEQLRLAGLDGRCFVTRDIGDFARLTVETARRQGLHAGVLVVPRSLTDRYPERIADALVEYARAHPDGVPSYCLDFL